MRVEGNRYVELYNSGSDRFSDRMINIKFQADTLKAN